MNPDELLQQIGELLGQYIAVAPDSPLAAEAQGLLASIDQGGAEEEGMLPPGPEGASLDLPGTPPEGEPEDLEEPPPSDAKTFEGARASAEERLTKRNKKTRG